ncbi:MAG: IclR family transcriptional regulator [Lentisphaerae bacterium]|nr:IclR family transcriptional regulator [Lentisphaerota bacterium]
MKKASIENRDNPYIVPALARGLRLLENICSFPEGCLPGELESTGIPPATLFRMLTTLAEANYIRRRADGRFQVTGKLGSLAFQAAGSTSLVALAENPMRKLRDKVGETVLLGIIHGDRGVILHQEISRFPVKVVLEIGHNFPLHSAAPAKAIMANMPENQQEELMKTISFSRFTEYTVRNAQALFKEFASIRKSGAAFDRGEEDLDIHCVAVPVFDTARKIRAALWISGPASRLTEEKMQSAVPYLKEAAESIFTL